VGHSFNIECARNKCNDWHSFSIISLSLPLILALCLSLCLFSFPLCNWRQNWHANKFCRKRGSLFLASQFVRVQRKCYFIWTLCICLYTFIFAYISHMTFPFPLHSLKNQTTTTSVFVYCQRKKRKEF